MTTADTGFTLLEVLVALVIVAVGIAASARLMTQSVELTDETRIRQIAHRVAANQLEGVLQSRQWPISEAVDSSESMGGFTWRIDTRVIATPNPDMVRIEVGVRLVGDYHYGQLFAYKANLNHPLRGG